MFKNFLTSASESLVPKILGVYGDVFSIKKSGNYTFAILDETSGEDVSQFFAAMRLFADAYKTNEPIVARLSGHDYKQGRVTDISFNSSDLFSSTTVVVSIEEIVNLNDDTSSDWLNVFDQESNLIEDFSETYSYERSGNRFSYRRVLNFQFSNLIGPSDFESSIKAIRERWDTKRFDYTELEDGISEEVLVTNELLEDLEEDIDEINLSYSLTQTLDSHYLDEIGNVSYSQRTKDSIGGDGFTTRVIEGSILSKSYNKNTTLKDFMSTKIEQVIQSQNGGIFGDEARPISVEKGFSVDEKSASFTLTFSSDPASLGGKTVSYSVDAFGDYKIRACKLQATFSDSTADTSSGKMEDSILYWQESTTNMKDLVFDVLGTDETGFAETSHSLEFDYGNSTVTATVEYDANEDIYPTGDNGVLVYKLSAKSNNIQRHGEEHRHEIAHDLVAGKYFFASNKRDKKTSASATANIVFSDTKPVIERREFCKKEVVYDDVIESIINVVSGVAGGAQDLIYVSSDSFTLNLLNNQCSRTIEAFATTPAELDEEEA